MIKRILSVSFLGLFLVFLSVSLGSGQTAQEILAKMVEAQGGKAVLEGIKDMTLTGTIDLVQQGLSGPLTVYKKEPDKRRVDVELMGMLITQAYDGQQAWGFNPQTMANEVKSGEEETQAKREALPIVSVLYPEKYGITYTYKGKESVEGKDYFVLEETYSDGFKAAIYLDPATYLTYKVKAKISNPMLGDVDFEQFPTDYKKVNGMTIAHSITSFTGGAEYMKITVKEVTFNKGIEDSFFKMK